MEYQRATKSAQKARSKKPPSLLHETSLNLRSQNMQIDTPTQAFVEPCFGHDFSQIAIHSTQAVVPQAKLEVNQPGDVYEQEADQVAEQVMRMTHPEAPIPDDEDETKNSLMRKQSNQTGTHIATDALSVPPIVHDVLSDSGQPLDMTTRAFMEPRFGHDFSQVRVHTDERAAESAQAVNALAYTVGRDVVFGTGQYMPETNQGKRLLAHELTHVIQQGTTATMGRGQRQLVTPLGASLSVQRRAKLAEKAETNENIASNVLHTAADVLQHGRLRLLGAVDFKYQDAIQKLLAAKVGTNYGKEVSGADRLQMLDAALRELHPAFTAFEKDSLQKAWLETEVTLYVDQLRENLNMMKARERIENAAIGPGDTVIEIPKGGNPRAEAAVLHARILQLLQTVVKLHEQAARLGKGLHEAVHGEAHVAEHVLPQLKKKEFDLGRLEEIQNVLSIVDSFLTLTDEEFQSDINHIHGFFNAVSTFAELVKEITVLTGGTVGVVASFSASVAKATGQVTWASQATHLARETSWHLGNVIAGIEIVHGIAVLLDSHSEDEQKVKAVRDIAMGTAWFGGRLVTGTVFGGAGPSTVVLLTYYELQLMVHLYGQARTGIMAGWMSKAFETMNESAQRIGNDANELVKAGLLLYAERQPEQQRALDAVLKENAITLGWAIDNFLSDCKPVGYGPGVAYKPGAYEVLRREFAPLLSFEGTKTPKTVGTAAVAILKKIGWCFEHARELLREASGLPVKEKDKAAGGQQGEHS